MPEEYTTAELTCKSCQQIYDPAKMSWSQADDNEVIGTALCDICEPWVEYSRARTNKFPQWARTLVHDDPGLIDETRAALEKIIHQNHHAQWGPRGLNGREHPLQGHNQLGPHNDWAWLEFIEWCVGRGHPEIIDGFNHAEARDNDDWVSDELDTVTSITEWFNHIRREAEDTTDAFSFTSEEGFIYAETHSLGDHEIIVHDTTILVDGVEFGDRSGDSYWLDPEILPELLFDSLHGLDSRPIEFRAELYSLNTQCLQHPTPNAINNTLQNTHNARRTTYATPNTTHTHYTKHATPNAAPQQHTTIITQHTKHKIQKIPRNTNTHNAQYTQHPKHNKQP